MDDADRYRLTSTQHERIFRERIIPQLTQRISASMTPVAVILGGQPGAGKSALQSVVALELAAGSGVLSIVGDDLRAYHPRYRSLLRADDKAAAFYTDRDSAGWIEKLIDHGKDKRFNLLIESTMRVAAKVCQTATSLRDRGYRVEARVLAVHEHWSVLGIHQRYERMLAVHGRARFTIQSSHDAAFSGVLQTVDSLEKERLVDRMVVHARGNIVLYENASIVDQGTRTLTARDAIETERARPWFTSEKITFAIAWSRVLAVRRARAAQSEDLQFARAWLARACLNIHSDAEAKITLERQLSTHQFCRSERLAAGAAFESLPVATATRIFPALSPYFDELDKRGATKDVHAALRANIERFYPSPPQRQRTKSPDRGPER